MPAIDCARAILKYINDPDNRIFIANVFVAIAGAESNWRENAEGDRFYGSWSCNGYQSFGPWQINIPAHRSWLIPMVGSSNPCTIASWLKNYDNNARAAATVLSRQGFCAWTVYEEWCSGWPHNGKYRDYAFEAKKAVDAVLAESSPPLPPLPPLPLIPIRSLWPILVLAISLGLAGASLIFMSRRNK